MFSTLQLRRAWAYFIWLQWNNGTPTKPFHCYSQSVTGVGTLCNVDFLLTSSSPPHLLKGLVGMGFLRPSNIQGRALPHLLLSHTPPNMIGQSRSGTGKTGTFSVALLSRLDLTKPKVPQAMVIAPTRELAKQIVGVIETMGSFFEGQEGLTIHAAVPPDDKDTATPFRGPVQSMVVVGTPGTIDSLIRTRRQLNTSQMKIVVLDEADQMLSAQGHGDSSLRIRRFVFASFFL